MKKIVSITTAAFSSLLLTANKAIAAVDLKVTPPDNVGVTAPTGTVLTSAFRIIFFLAALVVLFMLILGAFQWITSGGDKEAVGKARGRIVSALVGLLILALAVLIIRVVGSIVNIDIFNLPSLPSLNGN